MTNTSRGRDMYMWAVRQKSKPCESKGNYIQFSLLILSLFQKSSLGFFFVQIDNQNIWQVNKN